MQTKGAGGAGFLYLTVDQLTVSKTGTGSGTVTSSPAGISCGTDCKESYGRGTSVTLTATVTSGSTFDGWSGACTGTASTCTVTMDTGAAKAVTATFNLPRYTLTVNKAGTGSGTVTSYPAGINCGADCTESYTSGTSVTLTATAASGWAFAGWSGPCTGMGSCTVSMSAAKTVTATFMPGYSLTVSKFGAGSGTVASDPAGISCGTDCSESYTSGTWVTLTASAASSSTFAGWGGACSGTASTCTVSMDAAKTVTANFNLQQIRYTLTVNKAGIGSGTVTSDPAGISCGMDCSEPYTSGTWVTLTASAASSSIFAGWSGVCSGTASTCTVSMSAARTVTATFNPSSPSSNRILAGFNSAGQVYYSSTLTRWTNIPGTTLNQLIIGDFNSNGFDDLAGLSSTGKIYYSTNRSSWTNIPGTLSQLVAADFDGDGKKDDLAGINSTGQIYYSTNLRSWTNIPGTLRQLVVGDFNNDGVDDLAGINSTGQVYYSTNRRSWTNIPGALSQLVAADFDGDGKKDDLAGINSAGQVYYSTNRRSWTNIPGALSQLLAADFDGDGLDDLAGLNSAGKIYYSTNLLRWTNIPGTLSQLVATDFNRDGVDDLAGISSTGQIYYSTNRSSWTNIPGLLNRLARY